MFTRSTIAILCLGWFAVPEHAVALPAKPAQPKPGEVAEVEIAKGVKMKLCWIPAGKAMLGSPKSEKDRFPDETEHEYSTTGFWLEKYPVTHEEWEAVIGKNPSHYVATQDAVKKAGISDTPFTGHWATMTAC
jgi:formylglycine-generating enzyme required for sulfatase activity